MAQIPNKLLYFSQGSTYRTRQEDEEIRDDSIVFVEDDASIVARQNIFGVRGVYPGTCTTAAGTAAKVATTTPLFPLDSNGKPLPGTTIAIKFSNTNTYKTAGTTMTLNVNSTGAYPIYYNNAEVVSTTSANTIACGYKDRYTYYIFNGTQWVWLSYGIDANTTYSNYTFGNGYGIQYDDGTTTEIEVAFTSYALTDNGRVSVLFRHDVPANATLNINAKGAKPIYVDTDNPVTNEMKIKGGVIKAGDIATFVYKTTQYKATGTGTTTLNRYVLVGINDDHSKQDKPIGFLGWSETYFNDWQDFPKDEANARELTSSEAAAIQDIHENAWNKEWCFEYGMHPMTYSWNGEDANIWTVLSASGDTVGVMSWVLHYNSNNEYWFTEHQSAIATTDIFATVATSGSYNDLTNKPSLFSGSYNDLTDKPTIPTSADINAAKPFIVAVTESNNDYSADKTFSETHTAWESGREVLLVCSGNVYTLIESGNDYLGFMSTFVDSPVFFKIYFYDDDSFEKFEHSLVHSDTFDSSLANKQDKLTFDNAPTANSNNPVKSGGVYTALADKVNSADLAGVATSGSYNDLTDKPTIPAAITVDSTITQNGTNPVQGGAIYSALERKEDKTFVININYSNSTYSADKTPLEIYEAYMSGKTLIVKRGSNTYALCVFSGEFSDDLNGEIEAVFYGIDVITQYILGFYLYAYCEDGVSDITWELYNNQYVPTTRKINNKSLSTDVTLTASDVGALPSNTHIPNDIKVGSVAGKLYRNNVGGSGNFSISGNSGCIPNLTAGTFLVSVYAKSETQSYTFRFSFGSVTYDLSTTNGEINDLRQITIPSSGTFSGSVLNGSVAPGTILYVVMYDYLTPVSTVGVAAVTNRYSDLDGTPNIPTVNNGTLTIQQNEITVGTFTANQSSNTTANIYSTMFGTLGQSGFERDNYNSIGSWAGVETVTPNPLVTYVDILSNKLYRYDPITTNYVDLGGSGSGNITSTAITDLTDIL